MRILCSRYQLRATRTFNSRSDADVREGSLLRVAFADRAIGFADLCPFPAMGDLPLEIELRHLAAGKPSALAQRSLQFARLDATARAQGMSLYDPKARIENHFLITDLTRFDAATLDEIAAGGYRRCKIKTGRDLAGESERLRTFCGQSLGVRLDFNATLSRDRFAQWLDTNLAYLLPVLEFIEDPFPYDARQWSDVASQWPVRLALDRAADPVASGGEGAAVIVVKPAVQDVDPIIETFAGTDKRFVFTHYMDSPVGQMCALVAAQQAWRELPAQMLVCGLQHHDGLELSGLQHVVESDGPFIVPPQGCGLGFDSVLERRAWTELVA